MWAYESNFYQIYTIGFCGAPYQNDGSFCNRIKKVTEWIPHLKRLDVDAVYFTPIFKSESHGYNTVDYTVIDNRLGTNEDFREVCNSLHKAGIKVVLDGVFNHVGRDFPQFKDVVYNRENSRYRYWFNVNLTSNNGYNDGLSYEGWEGHYELVRLNLANKEVRDYLIGAVGGWMNEFGIDGLRLDVAYLLNEDFIRELHNYTKNRNPEFFLLGEIIHGDYNRIMNDAMLDSVTNYECYKGLYSSFNSRNMFEISYSLNRQFGPEQWSLYRWKHTFNFLDNHDVTRIISMLSDRNNIRPLYALLISMPGIPCIYYGSEWGAEGRKESGDESLRPNFDKPVDNDLSDFIGACMRARKNSTALQYGGYRNVSVKNEAFAFERKDENESVIVAVNSSGSPCRLDIGSLKACDIITGKEYDLKDGFEIGPYEAVYLRKK
jgi:cyclomaltodextrinase